MDCSAFDEVKIGVITCLERFGLEGVLEIVPGLIEQIGKGAPCVKESAIRALPTFGVSSLEALPALIGA